MGFWRYLDIFYSFGVFHTNKYDKSMTFFPHINYLVILVNAFESGHNIYLKIE